MAFHLFFIKCVPKWEVGKWEKEKCAEKSVFAAIKFLPHRHIGGSKTICTGP